MAPLLLSVCLKLTKPLPLNVISRIKEPKLKFDCVDRNNDGQKVRHLAAQDTDATSDRILYLLHAVGAERCEKDCHGCTEGCMVGGKKNGTAPAPPPSAQVCC